MPAAAVMTDIRIESTCFDVMMVQIVNIDCSRHVSYVQVVMIYWVLVDSI